MPGWTAVAGWRALLPLGLLLACTAAGPGDGGPSGADPDLPPGAVRVGEALYQIPVGQDAAGCVMYRLHSPDRLVAQVISFRRADGSFTSDRNEAVCPRGGRG